MKKYFCKFITILLSLFLFFDFTTREAQLFASDSSDRLKAGEILKESIDFKISDFQKAPPVAIQGILTSFLKYFFLQSYEYSISLLTHRHISFQGIPVPSLFDEMMETLWELMREQEWKGLARRYMRELRLRLVEEHQGDVKKVQKELLRNIDIWEGNKLKLSQKKKGFAVLFESIDDEEEENSGLSQKEKDFFALLRQEALGQKGPAAQLLPEQLEKVIHRSMAHAKTVMKIFERFLQNQVAQVRPIYERAKVTHDEEIKAGELIFEILDFRPDFKRDPPDFSGQKFAEELFEKKIKNFGGRKYLFDQILFELRNLDDMDSRASLVLMHVLACFFKEDYLSKQGGVTLSREQFERLWRIYRSIDYDCAGVAMGCIAQVIYDPRIKVVGFTQDQIHSRAKKDFEIFLKRFIHNPNPRTYNLSIYWSQYFLTQDSEWLDEVIEKMNSFGRRSEKFNLILRGLLSKVCQDGKLRENINEFANKFIQPLDIAVSTNTPEDAWKAIWGTTDQPHLENAKKFLETVTSLRELYPYQLTSSDATPPLQFAIKNGIYFPIGGGLYVTPITQSFRRHTVFKLTNSGQVTFAFEVLIPGENTDRRLIATEQRWKVSSELLESFPLHNYCPTPLAMMDLPKGSYSLYGQEIEFSSKTPLSVMGFQYGEQEDGKRLDFITRPILDEIAKESGWDSDALSFEVAKQVTELTAATHALGYVGHNGKSSDHHTGNFRLILTGDRARPIKIKLVGDFEAFTKVSYEDQINKMGNDVNNIVPRLSLILDMDAEKLKKMFEEARDLPHIREVSDRKRKESLKNDFRALLVINPDNKDHLEELLASVNVRDCEQSVREQNNVITLGFFFEDEFLDKHGGLVLSQAQYDRLWKIYNEAAVAPEYAAMILGYISKVLNDDRISIEGQPDKKQVRKTSAQKIVSALEITSPTDNPKQAWKAIFGTTDQPHVQNTQKFIEMATLLRKIFPYELSKEDPRSPLKYALEEGIYFPIGGGLFMTPVTESFRRHMVFKLDDEGQVLFAFEVMIPGEEDYRRDIGAEKRWKVATDIIQNFPDEEYCIVPIEKAVLPSATYLLYGKSVSINASQSLCIMGFEYGKQEDGKGVFDEDGKRLEFVTRAMVNEIAKEAGWEPEALALEIARQVAELTAATHVLGYVGHINEGDERDGFTRCDHHTGNFRLIVRKGKDVPIKVKLVDDFRSFRKISFEEKATAVFVDHAHIVIGIPDISMIGLSEILYLSEIDLLGMFEEAENKQILSKIKNLGKGEFFIDYGKRKDDLKTIFRNYIMTMSYKEHFRNQLLDAILQESTESFAIENLLQILSFFFDEEFLPEPQKVVLTPEQYTKMWKIYEKVENDRDNAFVILDCLGKILSDERIIVSGWVQKSEGYSLMQGKFKRFLDQKRVDPKFQTRGFGFVGVATTPWVNFFIRAGVDAVEALDVPWDNMLLDGLIYPLCQEPVMKAIRQRLLKQIVPGSYKFDVKPVIPGIDGSPTEIFGDGSIQQNGFPTETLGNDRVVEALQAIFGTQEHPNIENSREFFRVATLLRKVFPYELSKDDPRPPLQYAIEEGIYFEIAPGLYMTPITESFRRHIIFKMTEPGKVDFACEVLIPGELEDRRDFAINMRKKVSSNLKEVFGDEYCVETIFDVQFPYGKYQMYGDEIIFNEKTPLNLLAYAYEDGKRMEFLTQDMLIKLADKMQIRIEDLEMKIARKAASCVAATHALGYVGRKDKYATSETGAEFVIGTRFDHHLGNFRLIVKKEDKKITIDVELVGDFGAFRDSTHLQRAEAFRKQDIRAVVEGENRFPGLVKLLNISKEKLYEIFEQEQRRLNTEVRDLSEMGGLAARPLGPGFSGLPDSLEESPYRPVIEEKMDKKQFKSASFSNGKFSSSQVMHEKTGTEIGQSVTGDNLDFLNNVEFSSEDRKALEGLTIIFIDGLDEAVKKKAIELGLTILEDCKGAHYGISRPQIYLDASLLDPTNKEDLIRQLHHEVQERKAVLDILNSHFKNWKEHRNNADVQDVIEIFANAKHRDLMREEGRVPEEERLDKNILQLSIIDLEKQGYKQVDSVGPHQFTVWEKDGERVLVKARDSDLWFYPLMEFAAARFARKLGVKNVNKVHLGSPKHPNQIFSSIIEVFEDSTPLLSSSFFDPTPPSELVQKHSVLANLWPNSIDHKAWLEVMDDPHKFIESDIFRVFWGWLDPMPAKNVLVRKNREKWQMRFIDFAPSPVQFFCSAHGYLEAHEESIRKHGMGLIMKIAELTNEEIYQLVDEILPETLSANKQIPSEGMWALESVRQGMIIKLIHNRNIFREWFQKQPEYEVRQRELREQETRKIIQDGGVIEEGISVVCPVYRELENGNFFRLIESFTNQTAVTGNYELLLLINNMPGIKGPVFDENQRTLLIANFLENLDPNAAEPECLSRYSEEQKEIIRKARKIGLKVKVRDFSTQGIERNIGLIRDKGVQEVIAEYVKETGGDRVVAMMDADTIVSSNYVENILVHFSDPNLNYLHLDLDFQVTGEGVDEAFYHTLYHERWPGISRSFLSCLGNQPGGISPTIVARASALKKVGGVPHKAFNEDGELIGNLVHLGGYRLAHDVQAVTADRKRADGYNSASRGSGGAQMSPSSLLRLLDFLLLKSHKNSPPEIEAFLKMPEDYYEDRVERLISPRESLDLETIKFLRRYLSSDELDELEKRIQIERDKHEVLRKRLSAAVHVIVQNVLQNKDKQNWFEGVSDPEVLAFFKMNAHWVYKRIQDSRHLIVSPEAVLGYLEENFPDWFKPYDETRLKRQVTNIHVIINFLNEARNRSKAFPTTNLLLKVLEGKISLSEFLKTLPPKQIKTSDEGATFKFPGALALEKRDDWDIDFMYFLRKDAPVVDAQDKHLQTAIHYINEQVRGPRKEKSVDQKKIVLHAIDAKYQGKPLLGIPIFPNAYLPQDLLLVYGQEDEDDGALHIYITKAFWEKVSLEESAGFYTKALAEAIDHEWFEEREATRADLGRQTQHRRASERARFFTRDGQVSPLHQICFQMLTTSPFSEWKEWAKALLKENRKGNKSNEVNAYEKIFLENLKRVLLGQGKEGLALLVEHEGLPKEIVSLFNKPFREWRSLAKEIFYNSSDKVALSADADRLKTNFSKEFLIDLIIGQGEEGIVFLHKLIRPEKDGGISQSNIELRKYIWERIKSVSFEGKEVKVIQKTASRKPYDLPEDQVLFKGQLPQSGVLKLKSFEFEFKNFVGSDYELEFKDGFPIRIFFLNENVAFEFFPIIDRQTGRVITVHRGKISQKEFAGYDDVIVMTDLDSSGYLSIGGSPPVYDSSGALIGKKLIRARFNEHSDARVRVAVKRGIIHRCTSADSELDEEFTLIWSKSRQCYISWFSEKMYEEDFNCLNEDHEIHRCRLTDGVLNMGGEKNRITFLGHPELKRANVFDIRNPTGKKAFIVGAHLMDGERVVQTKKLSLVYTVASKPSKEMFEKEQLMGVFEHQRPTNLELGEGEKLKDYIISELRIEGAILTVNKRKLELGQYFPNAEVEVRVIDGEPRYLKFVKDRDENSVLDKDGQPLIIDLQKNIRQQMMEKAALSVEGPQSTSGSQGFSGLTDSLEESPYRPIIEEKMSKEQFKSASFSNGKFSETQVTHEKTKEKIGQSVTVSELDFLNEVELSTEDRDALKGLKIIFIDGLDEAVKAKAIELDLSPPEDCKGAHYGISRPQIYLDTNLLDPANKEGLMRQLYHEVQERKTVIKALDEKYPNWRTQRKQREYADEINLFIESTAAEAHDRLEAEEKDAIDFIPELLEVVDFYRNQLIENAACISLLQRDLKEIFNRRVLPAKNKHELFSRVLAMYEKEGYAVIPILHLICSEVFLSRTSFNVTVQEYERLFPILGRALTFREKYFAAQVLNCIRTILVDKRIRMEAAFDKGKALEKWEHEMGGFFDPALRFEMPDKIENEEQAWNVIFGNKHNEKTFLELVTRYRKFYSFRISNLDHRPPLQYALEEGIYFRIGPDLYVTPITQSFRRHIIFKKGPHGEILFAFEVMVPWEENDKLDIHADQRIEVANVLQEGFPDREYCPKPLFSKALPKGQYDLYGSTTDIRDQDGPLAVMAFDYKDGKRLNNVTKEDFRTWAEIMGCSLEDLAEDIIKQTAELLAALHRMGYVGQSRRIRGSDCHIGNIRIVFDAKLQKIKLEWVGDFASFQKMDPKDSDLLACESWDVSNLIGYDSIHAFFPGLVSILTMSKDVKISTGLLINIFSRAYGHFRGYGDLSFKIKPHDRPKAEFQFEAAA